MYDHEQSHRTGKIFQIGFNRCGTKFLHMFLDAMGYASVCWDQGNLALRMMENFKNGVPLVSGYEDRFDAFLDMEHFQSNTYAHVLFVRLLDEQYPGSKFILNTRHMDVWIQKRLESRDYVDTSMKYHGYHTIHQLMEKWRGDWVRHHDRVKRYFGNDRLGKDLIVYDVDHDNPQRLLLFLSDPGDVEDRLLRMYKAWSPRFTHLVVSSDRMDSSVDGATSLQEWFSRYVATYCPCLPERQGYMDDVFRSMSWVGDVWTFQSVCPDDVEGDDMRHLSSVEMIGIPRSPCPYCTMEDTWHPGIYHLPIKHCVHLSYVMCLRHALAHALRVSRKDPIPLLTSQMQYTLVLEDDVYFTVPLRYVMELCYEFAVKGGDVLYLGFGHCKQGQRLRRKHAADRMIEVPLHQQILCKHAILYRNTYLELMMPHLLPQVDCSDVHFNHVNMRLGARVYIAHPPIVFQDRHRLGSFNGNEEESRIPLYDHELTVEEEARIHDTTIMSVEHSVA